MKIFIIFFALFLIFQSVRSLSNICYGYWATWSVFRSGNGNFTVNDIDPTIFTHLAYSFVGIDSQANVVLLNPYLDVTVGNIANFIALKKKNPKLKCLVAIGGWNEASSDFSKVASDPGLRAKFVQNVVNFLNKYKFDGLDVDWEYPAQRGGSASDYQNYIVLLQQLKNAFRPRGWLLVTAVGCSDDDIQTSYNIPAMNGIVDFFNIMTYDFHGSWESVTGVNAPLFAQKTDPPGYTGNVNSAIRSWISHGASPGKIVMGVPAYGHSFKLANVNDAGTGAPTSGIGAAGPYTQEDGMWGYLEICEAQKNNPGSWHKTNVDNNYVYANNDDLWIGYDDQNTIHKKGAYAKGLGLAGVMFWAIDMEDFRGICGPKYSLVRAAISGYNGN